MSIDKIDYTLIGLVGVSLVAIILSTPLALTAETFEILKTVLYNGLVALGFKKVPVKM